MCMILISLYRNAKILNDVVFAFCVIAKCVTTTFSGGLICIFLIFCIAPFTKILMNSPQWFNAFVLLLVSEAFFLLLVKSISVMKICMHERAHKLFTSHEFLVSLFLSFFLYCQINAIIKSLKNGLRYSHGLPIGKR